MNQPRFTKNHNVTSAYFDDKMIDMIKQQFDLIDTDGSGYLDHDELKELFSQLGFEASKEEIDAMIEKADKDNNGEVDFEEFLSALSEDSEIMNIEKLCDIEFKKYSEKSGSEDLVDAEGIFAVCREFGIQIGLAECKNIISAINDVLPDDNTKDKRFITKAQFTETMRLDLNKPYEVEELSSD